MPYLTPYWRSFAVVLAAGTAATAFGLLQPYVSKLLIDEALLKHNLHMLWIVSGMMFGLAH